MAIRYCKRSVAVRALFEAAIACDVPMLIDGGGLGIAANYAYKWGNDVFTQRAVEAKTPLLVALSPMVSRLSRMVP